MWSLDRILGYIPAFVEVDGVKKQVSTDGRYAIVTPRSSPGGQSKYRHAV